MVALEHFEAAARLYQWLGETDGAAHAWVQAHGCHMRVHNRRGAAAAMQASAEAVAGQPRSAKQWVLAAMAWEACADATRAAAAWLAATKQCAHQDATPPLLHHLSPGSGGTPPAAHLANQAVRCAALPGCWVGCALDTLLEACWVLHEAGRWADVHTALLAFCRILLAAPLVVIHARQAELPGVLLTLALLTHKSRAAGCAATLLQSCQLATPSIPQQVLQGRPWRCANGLLVATVAADTTAPVLPLLPDRQTLRQCNRLAALVEEAVVQAAQP